MRSFTIPSSWFSWSTYGRMDAGFWEKVRAAVNERNVQDDDREAVTTIIKEVEHGS